MASKFYANLIIRCRPTDVEELDCLALAYDCGKSAVARAALREGIKIIKKQGIRPIDEKPLTLPDDIELTVRSRS